MYGVPLRDGPNECADSLAHNPAMQNRQRKSPIPPPEADPLVARARRKESVRGAIKLFRVIMDAVRRHAEWAEARHDLTAPQLWAVWELHQSPGLRAVDLAKAMAVHRSAAEALLQALEAQGLVARQALVDEAATGHCLTEAGKRLAEATPEHGQHILKTALEQLPDGVLEQIVNGLRPVVENLPFREERAAHKPMSDLLRLASSRRGQEGPAH